MSVIVLGQTFPTLVGILLTNKERELKREEQENSIRKKSLTNKGVRNIKENIMTNQVLKNKEFLEKSLTARQEKIIVSIGHAEK